MTDSLPGLEMQPATLGRFSSEHVEEVKCQVSDDPLSLVMVGSYS